MASGYRRTAGTLKVVSGAKGQHRRLDATVGFFELNRSCRDEARTSIERLNRLIANIGFNDDAFGTGQGESVKHDRRGSTKSKSGVRSRRRRGDQQVHADIPGSLLVDARQR